MTDGSNNQEPVKAGFKTPWLFWIAAFALVFATLGGRALSGSEDRWAEISRWMLVSGDWLRPVINGETYFDKPLLSYWLICLTSLLSGLHNEWIVRIPGALSAIAALWAVVWLGGRLWSRSVGLAAGWIMLGCYGFLVWARTASADMENMAVILVAVAWYWRREGKANFSTYFVFYLICFVGAHFKGLLSVVVPVLAIMPDLLSGGVWPSDSRKGWAGKFVHYFLTCRWRAHFNFQHFAALALCSLVYFVPFWAGRVAHGKAAAAASDAAGFVGNRESGIYMVFRENVERFFRPFDHKDPFYSYFYHLPRLLIPWSPLFLLAFARMFYLMRRRSDRQTNWLLWSVIAVFLFFSASGSRRWYYILPALPFCCLLTAVYMDKFRSDRMKRWFVVGMETVFFTVALLEFVSPLVFMSKKFSEFSLSPVFLWGTSLTGLLTLAVFFLKRRRPEILERIAGVRDAAPLCLAAVILMGGFFIINMTLADKLRTEKSFAHDLKALSSGLQPSEIAFFKKTPVAVFYYMGLSGSATVLNDAESAREFVSKGRGVLVSERRYLAFMPPDVADMMSGESATREKSHEWERKKDSDKKHIALRLDKNTGADK